MSKYTWSRMTPNPVAHLTDPADTEFQMPLCGARLDIRTQTLGDRPPAASVPVCGRCEARQRANAKREYDAFAARYRQALAKLMGIPNRDYAIELAAVTSMTIRNERLAWLIADLPENYEGGAIIEAMRELPAVWNREMTIEDLKLDVATLESLTNNAKKD